MTTLEERAERLRMCLAEAGYPDNIVNVYPDEDRVTISSTFPCIVPQDIARRAWWLSGGVVACVACYAHNMSHKVVECLDKRYETQDCGQVR